MLLFHEDLEARKNITAAFLETQGRFGRRPEARRPLLSRVLKLDPNHAMAMDLRGRAAIGAARFDEARV